MLVWVLPGRKPQRQVFSWRSSYYCLMPLSLVLQDKLGQSSPNRLTAILVCLLNFSRASEVVINVQWKGKHCLWDKYSNYLILQLFLMSFTPEISHELDYFNYVWIWKAVETYSCTVIKYPPLTYTTGIKLGIFWNFDTNFLRTKSSKLILFVQNKGILKPYNRVQLNPPLISCIVCSKSDLVKIDP